MIVLPVFFVRSASRVISAVVSSAARPDVGSSRKRMTGIGHELERDVDALALPAGEDLLLGLADLEVLHRLEAEVLQRLLDAAVDLLLRVVGREAEARRVLHRLEDGELGVDDVVLRDVADGAAERVVDRVEVLAVDADLAAGRRQVAVQRHEERRLARARRAHQRDHVARERLEGHVVEQGLHLTLVVAVGHLEKEVPGLDLVERLARPRGRSSTTTLTRLSCDLDDQRHRADVDLLAVGTGTRCPGARRWPRTNVPLPLPRSSRKRSSPCLTICACLPRPAGG